MKRVISIALIISILVSVLSAWTFAATIAQPHINTHVEGEIHMCSVSEDAGILRVDMCPHCNALTYYLYCLHDYVS